jgi:hypothetical protein
MLLAVLSCFVARYTYANHVVLHLLAIGFTGFIISIRFFMFI